MKRTILLGSFAFMGLAIYSCSGGSSKTGSDTTATTSTSSNSVAPLDSNAQHFRHGGGHRVPMTTIQPCLDAYTQVMSTYGITSDSPSVPMTKCPPMTYRITSTEGLTYAYFKNWLDSIVAVIDPVGKGSNVWIKIQPGIVTQQYAMENGLPASKIGRINYFVVPALIDSTKGQGNGGGGDGYDVGGLQP